MSIVFIDGETEPRLRGTGTEDYFCDGWGFRPQDGPYYGVPVWEGYEAGCRASAYRFHLADPIPFKKSLKAEIEHKGSQTFPDGTGSGYIEREDLMSSVAFWYQDEPHKPWPALPPGPERLPSFDKPMLVGWKAVEKSTHSEHPISVQNLGGVTDGKQLFFQPKDDRGWVEMTFSLDKETTVELIGKMTHSYDYGRYRVILDGNEVEKADLYHASVIQTSHKWGKHKLRSGAHTLRFECFGKAEASSGYFLGFDALVVRQTAYVRPDPDLRKLQAK